MWTRAPLLAGCWLAAAFALGMPAVLAARQVADDPWMPGIRYFPDPMTDPRAPGLGVGLIWTNLLGPAATGPERPDFTVAPAAGSTELQAAVALGRTIPLFNAVRWPDGGIVLGIQAGVFARFRLDVRHNHLMATDWLVALPIELAAGDVSARLRFLHWSAHLGDEFMDATGAARINFGHEAVDLLLAYSLWDAVRIYGGATGIIHSTTDKIAVLQVDVQDRAEVQAGAELVAFPWARGRLGVMAAVDWKRTERARWSSQLAAVAGGVVRGRHGALRLVGTYFNGPSPSGQFFLTPERVWGIEAMLQIVGPI